MFKLLLVRVSILEGVKLLAESKFCYDYKFIIINPKKLSTKKPEKHSRPIPIFTR